MVPALREPDTHVIICPNRYMAMNATSSGFTELAPRSLRAALQFGLAVLGAVVALGSLVVGTVVLAVVTLSGDAFAGGLVILVFGVYALAGFLVLAVGLWIPQREREGIRFSPRQRRLLAYGAVAPIAGVLAVPIGATVLPPLPGTVYSVLVAGLVGLLLSGPVATLFVVGSKLRSGN